MRSLLLFLFCFTLCGVTYSQDRLITVDSVTVPCRIQSATSQLVYFTGLNANRQDSLPTLQLRELQYADSVRVLVVPAPQRGQVRTLVFADFDKAWRQEAYTTLLHAKTSRYDLTFLTGQVALTNEGRRKALALATLLKTRPAIHVRLTVHTDTLGQAASNKGLSDRRAAALQNFFVANGISSRNLLVEGRGESEAILQSQTLNRRLELQVIAIDGVKELYGETYIPLRGVTASTKKELFGKATGASPSGGAQVTDQSRNSPNNSFDRSNSVHTHKGLTLFLHASGTQIISGNDWTNSTTGNGFTQGVGGDIQIQYRFSRGIALALTASHTIWKVRQNYIDSTTRQTFIRWDYQLTHSEALLTLKLYPVGSVYVAPEGGITWINYETRHGQPDNVSWPVFYQSYNPVIGASLGNEFRVGSIRLDVNAFCRYVSANELGVFQPQSILRVGIRLGIGFSFTK